MEYKKYRVGDLKERIRENAEKSKSVSKISVLEANETKNEFEPVFGKNYISGEILPLLGSQLGRCSFFLYFKKKKMELLLMLYLN